MRVVPFSWRHRRDVDRRYCRYCSRFSLNVYHWFVAFLGDLLKSIRLNDYFDGRCLFVDDGRLHCVILRDRDADVAAAVAGDYDIDEENEDDVESLATEPDRHDRGANRLIVPLATLFFCSCPRCQEHLSPDDTPGEMPLIGFCKCKQNPF